MKRAQRLILSTAYLATLVLLLGLPSEALKTKASGVSGSMMWLYDTLYVEPNETHVETGGQFNVTVAFGRGSEAPTFDGYFMLEWNQTLQSFETYTPTYPDLIVLVGNNSIEVLCSANQLPTQDSLLLDVCFNASAPGTTILHFSASCTTIDGSVVVRPRGPVRNLNTGLSYKTIQEAIDANETLNGNEILVDVGTYDEQVLINKSISLVGENRDSTIINWTEAVFDPVVDITASNVEVSGFSLLGWNFVKIQASSCSNVTIRGNFMESGGQCIYLDSASSCTIAENVLWGGGLEGNDLVVLDSCSRCVIKNNTILGACYDGVMLIYSNNILVCNNNISYNQFGICFYTMGSVNREITVFHNNFEDNYEPIDLLWGGRIPGHFYENFEGNYWSDYAGKDVNQDGIGDTPYGDDPYPLMGPFQCFTASGYDIQAICNSTISSFGFNSTAMSFNVSGENGTGGFCRICIPTALLNAMYRVYVNGTEVPYRLLPISNSTQSYLYFTYHHSTQEVIIIPEFPPFSLLSIFMLASLIGVVLYGSISYRLEKEERTIKE